MRTLLGTIIGVGAIVMIVGQVLLLRELFFKRGERSRLSRTAKAAIWVQAVLGFALAAIWLSIAPSGGRGGVAVSWTWIVLVFAYVTASRVERRARRQADAPSPSGARL